MLLLVCLPVIYVSYVYLVFIISLPSRTHTVTILACAGAAESVLDGNVDKVMVIPYFLNTFHYSLIFQIILPEPGEICCHYSVSMIYDAASAMKSQIS